MKKRVLRPFILMIVAVFLSVSALAAMNVILSVGGSTVAFSSKVVNSRVDVYQTTAAWQGVDGEVRWVLFDNDMYGAIDVIYLEGADSDYLSAYSPGHYCKLTGYNEESNALVVLYSYSIS